MRWSNFCQGLKEKNPKTSPSAKRKSAQMVRNNPGATKAQACHEAEAAGAPYTVKRALHHHGLKEAPAPESAKTGKALWFRSDND